MSEIAQIKAVGEEQASEPLPHNIEAEQQLLGAILTNNDIYDRVAGVINETHFYDPVHARIYEVAASRIAKNALASPVTLTTRSGGELTVHFNRQGGRFTDVFLEGDARVIYRGELWEDAWLS